MVVEDDGEPPLAAMRDAVGDNTAAIFCMAHRLEEPGSLQIEDYAALSRESGVPLVADAASECPPMSTLTRFCREGADLVIFSGGKSLLGPQSTGLVVGRRDLIAACAANGNPFATVGRPMKVSREEVIGFLKALESYLARDHEADRARWQAQVRHVEEALTGLPGIELQHLVKCGTYDTVPLLGVRPLPGAGFTRSDIFAALEAGEPQIMVSEGYADDLVVINPHMLQPGEVEIVAAAAASWVSRRENGPGTVMSGDACDCSGFSGMAQKRSLATADIPLPGLEIRPTENRRDSGGLRDSSDITAAKTNLSQN